MQDRFVIRQLFSLKQNTIDTSTCRSSCAKFNGLSNTVEIYSVPLKIIQVCFTTLFDQPCIINFSLGIPIDLTKP